ncbi:restriction endonuclease subunit S [Fulvivirga sp.]|uniref:restriction endonuclease subunit S n=1 Tax=Fulvivirga sp. TaxID=1931237 RepID=UPI0032EB1418
MKKFLADDFNLERVGFKRLDNIAEVKGGKRLPLGETFSNEGIPYIRAEDVKNGFVDYENSPKISEQTYEKIKRYKTTFNDILLTIVGNSIGDVGLVKFRLDRCNLTENCVRVFSKEVNPEVLFAYLISDYGQNTIEREKVGTAQPKLAIERISNFKIPKFGSNLQREVSDLVNFSNKLITESKSSYQKAEQLLLQEIGLADFTPNQEPVNVKSFQESFGTSGRLDAEYYQAKYDELESEIIKTGSYSTLGKLSKLISRGKQPLYSENDSKVLMVINSKHVRENKIIFDNTRVALEDDCTLFIEENDVVINGTGVGTIGRAAPYLYKTKAIPDNHVTIIRQESVSPLYLSVYLNTIAGQYQVEKYFKGSSGQIELYPDDISNFLIWIAPKDVQAQIEEMILSAFKLENQSNHLLEVAKRAVEIAIEESEEVAMEYIKHNN